MKRIYLIILATISIVSAAYSQAPNDTHKLLNAKALKARLESEIKFKSDSLAIVNKTIKDIEEEALLAALQDQKGNTAIPATIDMNGIIRAEPTPIAKTLATVSLGDTVTLLDYKEGYWLAKVGEHTGYINNAFIKHNEQSKAYKALLAKKNDKSPTNSHTTSGSTYKPSTSSSGSSTSKTIHTGSRGGKYYINSKGNKTYIKRK